MIFKIISRPLKRKHFLFLCHQKDAIFPKCRKFYHTVPFIDLYKEVSGKHYKLEILLIYEQHLTFICITGQPVTDNFVDELRRKYPKIFDFSKHQIQCTLKILNKFGITAEDACFDPHIFCMNHLLMDNYAEILKECNFTIILPKHIIR